MEMAVGWLEIDHLGCFPFFSIDFLERYEYQKTLYRKATAVVIFLDGGVQILRM